MMEHKLEPPQTEHVESCLCKVHSANISQLDSMHAIHYLAFHYLERMTVLCTCMRIHQTPTHRHCASSPGKHRMGSRQCGVGAHLMASQPATAL